MFIFIENFLKRGGFRIFILYICLKICCIVFVVIEDFISRVFDVIGRICIFVGEFDFYVRVVRFVNRNFYFKVGYLGVDGGSWY